MNEIVKKCCELTHLDAAKLVEVLDTQDNWGKMVHAFEFLTVLGVVKEAAGKLGQEVDELARIRDLHCKSFADGGMTSGYCNECDYLWPCPTYHVASGWGLDSFHDCQEAGWCSHVEAPLR